MNKLPMTNDDLRIGKSESARTHRETRKQEAEGGKLSLAVDRRVVAGAFAAVILFHAALLVAGRVVCHSREAAQPDRPDAHPVAYGRGAVSR